MTILLPDTASSQTIKYIPRYDVAVATIEFTDEQENTSFNATLGTETEQSYYNDVTFTLTTTLLKNARVYMIKLKDVSDNILFSDKVFSTDQPISTFSVNTGGYINAPGTANEYIIYE